MTSDVGLIDSSLGQGVDFITFLRSQLEKTLTACHGYTTDPKKSHVNEGQQGLLHTDRPNGFLDTSDKDLGYLFQAILPVKHHLLMLTPLCHFQVISAYLGHDSEKTVFQSLIGPHLACFHMRKEGVWKKKLYPHTNCQKSQLFFRSTEFSYVCFQFGLTRNWRISTVSRALGWEKACFLDKSKKRTKERARPYIPPVCAKGPRDFWPPPAQVNPLLRPAQRQQKSFQEGSPSFSSCWLDNILTLTQLRRKHILVRAAI